jgi:hypothetical protein
VDPTIDLIKTKTLSALQTGMGMMRVAELQAIASVAQHINARAYVSMGCGHGFDFLSLRENYRPIPAIGFDLSTVQPSNVYRGVEFHHEEIFQAPQADRLLFYPRIHEKIRKFLARNARPALFYTDNGRKIEELRELVQYVKSGDVMGTHDWGAEGLTLMGTYTEVHERECGFLYEAGFKVFSPIEAWIGEHKCLQRFWIRT